MFISCGQDESHRSPQKVYFCSQCSLTGFEKKNVSKVCRIFLESISYDNSKMVCLKILELGISELTLLKGPTDENIKQCPLAGIDKKMSKRYAAYF